MQRNNICKFVITEPRVNLSVSCFVLETNREIMGNPAVLTSHKMMLITKGEGTAILDGVKVPFVPGDLLFVFPGETHHIETKTLCEYMYMLFDGDRTEELFSRFHIYKGNRLYGGFDGLIPFWKDSLSRANKQTLDLVSESVLLYTFSRITQEKTSSKNALLHKILEMLDQQYRNPELSLSQIAKELSYNEKYISHLFKSHMGVGLSEYLRTLRIKYAISLLDYGIDSIKNVALLSGYTDPLYFSAVFKKEVGVSPKEYIKGTTSGSDNTA